MCTDYLKTLLQYVLPKRALNVFAGFMAQIEAPVIKNYLIHWFIHKYNVNLHEALLDQPHQYANFNAFFTRHLKPLARPVAKADLVSPVDGYVSECGQLQQGQMLQAKGRYYSVDELLACEARSALFHGGSFATLYLSPKDYHRVHLPMDATLQAMVHVPGRLFSVQPATSRVIPRLFARNERLVVFFETHAGPMAMVLVGAAVVGAIGTAWQGDLPRAHQRQVFVYGEDSTVNRTYQQADEMGYFKLGSTVILLFPKDAHIQWNASCISGARIQMGQALAQLNLRS